MIISVFDRVKNIVGKRDIACTSNVSFSHNVFQSLLSQTRQKVSLCGKVFKDSLPRVYKAICLHVESYFFLLTHYHTMTNFDALGGKPFVNIVGKEENAGNQHFVLYPQCFLSYDAQF